MTVAGARTGVITETPLVGRISDLFSGRSLEAVLKRGRYKLAAGDFAEATRVVEAGLERFPEAEALRELHLTIRRVEARASMQSLRQRIEADQDPLAYEQLVQLYQQVDMFEEARCAAHTYSVVHPDRDSPHLMLGEMSLQTFFEDLRAPDAHDAHDHLLRAARLNSEAIKPRLLLAELYYCVGAHHALSVLAHALERIDPDDEAILPVLEAITAVADPDGTNESVDGLFAQVEVDGQLLREPTTWPLRNRRNRDAQIQEERTNRVVHRLVSTGTADEVVVLRRNGTALTHACLAANGDDESAKRRVEQHAPEEGEESGLARVVGTIARAVSKQAREMDLGGFKRCSIQGPFGLVVAGRVNTVIAGARTASRMREPARLWESVSVKIDGVGGGR